MVLPDRGNAGMTASGEVVDIAVAVEAEVIGVATLPEEGEDVVLLLRCEKALAIVIPIVGAVAAKVIFDGSAQRSGIALLHVGKERVEAPGGTYLPYLLVMAASPVV